MDKRVSSGLSLAIILSFAIFISGFLWWSNYQSNKAEQKTNLTQKTETEKEENVCPVDAQPKICPDGNYAQRGDDCEYLPCPEKIVGGDKDEHGCIGSAGYSWCEEKQKCLRVWEENCDETTDWKVYKNEKYGLEFKYPNDWDAYSSKNKWNVEGVFKGNGKYDTTTGMPYSDAEIQIYTINNSKNISVQELFNADYKKCLEDVKNGLNQMGCPGAEDVSEWKSIFVGGIQALRSGMRPIPEGIPNDDVYIKLPGKYLVLSAGSGMNNQGNEILDIESVFDNILYTFKFTK
jgi:hypothetical protein